MYTGVRRSDVVRLGRHTFGTAGSRLRCRRTKSAGPLRLIFPFSPCCKKSSTRARSAISSTFLVTAFKRPFTANGFGNWFRRRCDEAGLPDCSAHGLRKAGAARAAENGATTHELMAIFGWQTVKEAERYTQAAQRKRLAEGAERLLNRRKSGVSEPKIPTFLCNVVPTVERTLNYNLGSGAQGGIEPPTP